MLRKIISIKILLLFNFCVLYFTCSSQKITGAAMLDEKGNVTSNQKKAKYLIVLKKINDTSYEKLNYNFAGCINYKVTYKDSLLTNLSGTYADFSSTGYISSEGKYLNAKKEGKWYEYDDTAHATFEYNYHLDSLFSIVDLDSLSNEKKKTKEDTTGQVEADYKGGIQQFQKIIQKNLKIPERTLAISKGGTAKVQFVVDTTGKPIDTKIIRSVEFALDEEAMRVIGLANDWISAVDKGRKVKAYRILPITISIQDR